MTKLSVNLIQSKLLKEDEVKKATYQKQELRKNRQSKEVGKPKDLSGSVTKITQIEVPSEKSLSKASEKPGIPQADFAYTYTDKQKNPTWSKSGDEGSPKVPSTKRDKPNQTTKLKQVGKTIKNTEADKEGGMGLPAGKDPSKTVDAMPRGSKNLNASGDDVPVVKAPKAASLNSTTRPKGGERKASFDTKDRQKPDQTKQPSGDLPTPSDAPKKVTFKTEKQGHNVRESAVAVIVNGKTKGRMEVVTEGIVKKLQEQYGKFGYKVDVKPVRSAWMDDKAFLKLMREWVDAKFNFVPTIAEKARKEAFQRFYNTAKSSYNGLFESRQDFLKAVKAAFALVEKRIEKKYVGGLELFECTARVRKGKKVFDMTVLTEATGHEMAARQVRQQIIAEYGFDLKLRHVFVDGKKFAPEQIVEWAPVESKKSN